MSDLITDTDELIAILKLDPALSSAAKMAANLFPLRVPRSFVERMEIGNVNDPLLKQVLPLGAELNVVSGFSRDPLGEQIVNPVPGLLHKYPGRVLITLASACAVHCRYCFRRFFPYEDNNPGRAGWTQIIEYIQANETINEVILSGGDPLSVNDAHLQQFTNLLMKVEHVNRLRIHTRLPVMVPTRITSQFLAWARDLPLQLVMVLHINHAREINEEVAEMLVSLRETGMTLLNQSVLLKGVNDDIQTLATLSETLFTSGVLPYYLHLLDKVEGAAHFDVEASIAKALHNGLVQRLPGYLVPRLVYEQSGESSKTLLS